MLTLSRRQLRSFPGGNKESWNVEKIWVKASRHWKASNFFGASGTSKIQQKKEIKQFLNKILPTSGWPSIQYLMWKRKYPVFEKIVFEHADLSKKSIPWNFHIEKTETQDRKPKTSFSNSPGPNDTSRLHPRINKPKRMLWWIDCLILTKYHNL